MDFDRELVAYGIVAVIAIMGLPVLIRTLRRRKREALRRKGVKTFGH